MRVAAFETSGRCVSVALFDSDTGETKERSLEARRERGRRLVAMLQELLDEADLVVADVDLFAAGVGPGSYTGVRVGLSLASSLAYAAGKPIRGVSSLEVLVAGVEGAPGRPLVVAANAYRGELFASFHAALGADQHRREPTGPEVCLTPEALLMRVGADHLAAGEGVEAHVEAFAAAGVEVIAGVQARARDLAALALEDWRARGAHDALTLAPVHLRSTDDEFQKR